jgi:SAM-dependent methyltransferase
MRYTVTPAPPVREDEVPLRRPRPLRSLVPSPFVADCLKRLPRQPGGFAADFGAGFGRHARLLASIGYTVLAFDLDRQALKTLRARIARQRNAGAQVYPVVANVDTDLPLTAGRLDLALAVHCSIHDNLRAIDAALAPGGFLIYETFGGHGMNWQELPKAGQLQRKLKGQFELLVSQERRVGPAKHRSVVVRLLARKLPPQKFG